MSTGHIFHVIFSLLQNFLVFPLVNKETSLDFHPLFSSAAQLLCYTKDIGEEIRMRIKKNGKNIRGK
jgi:hypothetical protein